MLDINLIRQNSKFIKNALQKRGVDFDINGLLSLDKKRREKIQETEALRKERNIISSQAKDSPELIEKAKKIKEQMKKAESELKEIEAEFEKLFSYLPNIPLENVPEGQSESANIIIKTVNKAPEFSFKIKDHLELGQELDIIDTERAVKISGSRFGILKNEAALLQFALINFTFDFLAQKGFIPVLPPALIKPEAMKAMGHIDTKEDLEERYYLNKEKLFLIGTAEQSVGPMHQGEIFSEKDLPKRYLAFSSCFREEAGSYGKDTKGILRVHQFDKIEMFSFVLPEESQKEHQFLLNAVENLMQELELPYRVVHLCAGEMASPSASTYDIETWIPSEEKYRETHSISNCTDFQARRLNTRYKKGDKADFVHMLNATAFAMGRTIIAILENYQQQDGSIAIPTALKQYLKFENISKK